MGKKLYEETQGGGIRFRSERKPGEVRIPNYVYDIWLPLLGLDAIGVYSVYCRLERKGSVKSISTQTLAEACRIGKSKLQKINEKLERCKFIKVSHPEKHQRLMHWTLEIVVLDPPPEATPELIEAYQAGRGYQSLTPWLVGEKEDFEKEPTDKTTDRPTQNRPQAQRKPQSSAMAVPSKTAKIESLQPLDIVSGADAPNSSADILDDALGKERKGMPPPAPKRTETELLDEIQLASLRGMQRQGERPWLNWSNGRLKPRQGIDQESLDRVGWLIEKHTHMCVADGEWKGWAAGCADVYQAGQGKWRAIEAGIRTAWGRADPKYRPGHAKGFVKEVRKAATAARSGTVIKVENKWA